MLISLKEINIQDIDVDYARVCDPTNKLGQKLGLGRLVLAYQVIRYSQIRSARPFNKKFFFFIMFLYVE